MKSKSIEAVPVHQNVAVEPLGYKVISAAMAMAMHGGLIFLLILGVQWATDRTSTAPMTVDLWRPGDLSSASQASEARALGDAEPIESFALEPVEAAPLIEPVGPAERVESVTPVQPAEPAPKPADISLKEQKALEEKAAREEKQRQEKIKREAEEQKEKERQEAVAAQKALAEKERQAQRERALQESLARERAALKNTDSPGGGNAGRSGTGLGSAEIREIAAYQRRIEGITQAAMRSANLPKTPEGQSKPRAGFRIFLSPPDGAVERVVLTEPSGNAPFDRAAQAAIEKIDRLPPPDRWEWLPERYINVGVRPED